MHAKIEYYFFYSCINISGGHVVAQLVEALHYKPEGRRLEFFIDIILLAALWPWGRLNL
jgi:hypothetical protein